MAQAEALSLTSPAKWHAASWPVAIRPFGRRLLADLARDRTARPEAAAGRRVDRARNVAREQDLLAAALDHGVRVGHRAEQRLGVGMGGGAVDRAAVPMLHDLAEVHDVDPARRLAHHRQIVRDQHARHAQLVAQLQEEIHDLGADRHVERAHRLVADHHLRVCRERTRNADPLPLTARHLARVPVVHVPADPHRVEQLVRALPAGGGVAFAVDEQRLVDGLADGLARAERGVGVLEDVLDAPPGVAPPVSLQLQNVDALVDDLSGLRALQSDDGPAEG